MKRETYPYRDRIMQDPNVMAGKPVVRGTRIPVERVLQHREENDRADLFAAFPELTEEDIQACLNYNAFRSHRNVAVAPDAKRSRQYRDAVSPRPALKTPG